VGRSARNAKRPIMIDGDPLRRLRSVLAWQDEGEGEKPCQ
jgi:hypothetical protein